MDTTCDCKRAAETAIETAIDRQILLETKQQAMTTIDQHIQTVAKYGYRDQHRLLETK